MKFLALTMTMFGLLLNTAFADTSFRTVPMNKLTVKIDRDIQLGQTFGANWTSFQNGLSVKTFRDEKDGEPATLVYPAGNPNDESIKTIPAGTYNLIDKTMGTRPGDCDFTIQVGNSAVYFNSYVSGATVLVNRKLTIEQISKALGAELIVLP